MKRIWVGLALLVGCDSGKQVARQAQTGSGSGSGSGSGCRLDGAYRLRFHSNGTDGWWLMVSIKDGKATIDGGMPSMLGLAVGAIAITIDAKACSFAIAQHNTRAGDLHVAIAPEPNGAVHGNITRTDPYGLEHEPNTPVIGRRDTTPPATPACLKPGVYQLASDPNTKWKLSQGHPRFGLSCKDDSTPITDTHVRISVLGDQLFVDEVGSEAPYEQGFARGKVVRDGDCAITLSYEKQDFRFSDAKLVFADDKVSGVAEAATYDFFEDGEAGENLWKCSSKHVKLAGTRVAD
ncbi:MAG: hypothetical protein ABI678_07205 [Kofleriaceae bacterium]